MPPEFVLGDTDFKNVRFFDIFHISATWDVVRLRDECGLDPHYMELIIVISLLYEENTRRWAPSFYAQNRIQPENGKRSDITIYHTQICLVPHSTWIYILSIGTLTRLTHVLWME